MPKYFPISEMDRVCNCVAWVIIAQVTGFVNKISQISATRVEGFKARSILKSAVSPHTVWFFRAFRKKLNFQSFFEIFSEHSLFYCIFLFVSIAKAMTRAPLFNQGLLHTAVFCAQSPPQKASYVYAFPKHTRFANLPK